MLDTLDFDQALALARTLSTIPDFPRMEDAIHATAEDLVRWCQGAVLPDGTRYSAEAQAYWVVTEARDSWTRWQGSAGLRKLLQKKFDPPAKKPAAIRPLTVEEAEARGLILPPCQVCEDRLYVGERPNLRYCTACARGRREARWEGEANLHRLNAAVPPVNVSGWQLAAPHGIEEAERAVLEHEERRRADIAAAQATVDDPQSTRLQREVAMQVLLLYSAKGKRAKDRVQREHDRLDEVFKNWGVN